MQFVSLVGKYSVMKCNFISREITWLGRKKLTGLVLPLLLRLFGSAITAEIEPQLPDI